MAPPGHTQSTSLPSIRQLHPYLPPSSSSGMPQHISNEATYGYLGSTHYPSHLGEDAGSSHTVGGPLRDPSMYGAGESEADDLEQQSPPKKKRRRQALSCTGDYIQPFVIRVARLADS